MASVQDGPDHRDIRLDRVGIRDLVYPTTVPQMDGGVQSTVAVFALYVNLPPEARGTHMSRFVEVLNEHGDGIGLKGLEKLLVMLRKTLGADAAHVEADFIYFVSKDAPVSGGTSLLGCPTLFTASIDDSFDFVMEVQVPIMTVCPCSKEASGGPAHTQRGHVSVAVRYNGRLWIEEIVEIVESCASSAVYPLLKSEDEHAMIEQAHERPAFVEDVVRSVAERLDSDVRIVWYRIEAENLESVHDHNVYAELEIERR